MRNYFWEKNKIVFAIIIGAVIIGAFVYFALKPDKSPEGHFDGPATISSKANLGGNQQAINSKSVQPAFAVCGAAKNTIVTKVIDGDTVVVGGGYHIRLLGMDADETGYPCYEPAKIRLEELVLSKQVILEKDRTDLDQYGRCLRYIFLGNTNIDAQLVKEGLAIARFYEPDIKYKTEITAAEKQAQENKVGCKWSGNPQTE